VSTMRFTVLPVGQGTGTLIEILDDDAAKTPLAAILVDLGSMLWRVHETGFVSADLVAQELRRMNNAPTLNAVLLSHGDADHINLVGRLLDGFMAPSQGAPRNQTLAVENVWYAGYPASYTKRGVNFLTKLHAYRPGPATNVHQLGPDVSDLNVPLLSGHGLELYVITANTAVESTEVAAESEDDLHTGTTSYLNNTVSLVLLVAFGAQRRYIVVTGDATGMTIARCNTAITNYPGDLAPILSLTLPHHGSAVTTYDLLGAATQEYDRAAFAQYNVEWFVHSLRPQSLTVSAGEVQKYSLPSARMIMDFGKYLETSPYADAALWNTNPRQHFYTSYFERNELTVVSDAMTNTVTQWPPSEGWQTVRTSKAVYTTDYFRDPGVQNVPEAFPPNVTIGAGQPPYNPAPPWGAGWAFCISADGLTVTVERVFDLRTVSAADRAQLERLYGPLPAERFVFLPSAADAPGACAAQAAGAASAAQGPPPAPALLAAAPAHNARPAPPPGLRRVRQMP
jgi:hypothetical protein